MTVSKILNLKGSREVETITPDATLSDAITQLSQKRIGALVVSNTGEDVLGILSERDIVRMLGADGPHILSSPVSGAMTEAVSTCTLQDTAISVLERMSSGRFRHMPVVDDSRMIGLLSIGDVVKARIGEIEAENAAMAEMLSG